MKRLLLTGWLLLCVLMLNAQSKADSTRLLTDPLYLQLYVGINKSANENLPMTEFTKYPWSVGAFFGIGKEFNRLWGWRAALRFNHNKSRNVMECESKDTWGWNNTGLFADLTFDVSDVLRSKKKERVRRPRLNIKAFAGLGVAYTYQFTNVPLSYTHSYSRSSRLVPAGRAGLTATYQVARKWRVGVEASQTLFEDHFNGVAYGNPIDGRTNLKVGVTYLFAKKPKVKKPVVRKNRLKDCPILALLMPEPEDVKERQIVGRAFLDFPVNEMMIYPSYRNNPSELARIKATVDSALFDKTIHATQISLHGYASPESPYSNNTRLAKGRTESLMNYLIKKYSFDEKIFKNDYTPEDWENLRGFLNNMEGRRVKGDYWYDNKSFTETPEAPDVVREYRDELLRVIDSDMEPDAKEEVLKRVGNGEPYRWLLKHVYPGLRHTDYIINYEVRHYPVEEARKLIYTHPEALSMEEMYLVATSYEEGSDGWSDALFIAARQFPDDETTNLNAAYASLRKHHIKDAKQYLSKAGHSAQALYLNDIVLAMEGAVKWKMEKGRVMVFD